MLKSMRDYFYSTDLDEVICPSITNNNCEGGSDSFLVTTNNLKWGHAVYLTVSRQLHLEMATAMNNRCGVFSIGPVFRAEKHDSRRHLSEFTMAEVELSSISTLDALINHCENCLRFSYQKLITACPDRVHEEYAAMIQKPSEIITYDESIRILQKLDPLLKWGHSLNSSQEIRLSEYLGHRILFIINYPSEIKPFYMKKTELPGSRNVAQCFDCIMPNMGEIAGGSIREDDAASLLSSMQIKGIHQSNLEWYVNLRKMGQPSTGGYGIGVERLFAELSGFKNIRQACMFPRDRGSIKY